LGPGCCCFEVGCCCCFGILGRTLVDWDVTSFRFTIFFPLGLMAGRDPKSLPVEWGAPPPLPVDCGGRAPPLRSSRVDCLRGEGVALLLSPATPRGEIPIPARTGDRGDLCTTDPLGGGWIILISEMDLVASTSIGSSSTANVELKLFAGAGLAVVPISHCSSSRATRVTVSFSPPW